MNNASKLLKTKVRSHIISPESSTVDYDEEVVQALDFKRQKLDLPPTSAREDWERLYEMIERGTQEHKLAISEAVVCRYVCRIKLPTMKTPHKSSRQ